MRLGDPFLMRISRWLPWVFALVGLGSATLTVLAWVRVDSLERESQAIIRVAVKSIRLVGRMDHDIGQKRLVLDEEIVSPKPLSLAAAEADIERIDAMFSSEMTAYDQLVTFPGEREAWEEIKAFNEELQKPLVRALALHKLGRTAEARDVMMATRSSSQELRDKLDALLQLQDLEAIRNLARISHVRRGLLAISLGIGLTAILGLLVLGLWNMRHLALRREEAERYSRVLEERNRGLDTFAGHVAHDIRGPLSTISLVAQQLSRTAPEHRDAIDRLGRGVQRMDALINDLLALARVAAAKGCCDPSLVSAQVGEELLGRLDREEGTLQLAVEHVKVKCTEGLLHQALVNLLDNAIKYRRSDTPLRIEVLGGATGEGYDLRVSDNGVGMTSEDAARVFEPFFRASRTIDLPGTGLGLAIVKRVAEACHGSVSVTSRLGEGTSFVMHLPLAACDQAVGQG